MMNDLNSFNIYYCFQILNFKIIVQNTTVFL